MDMLRLGRSGDPEVISVTQLPPVADKLAPWLTTVEPQHGEFARAQVSYLIPSYISNWLEKNRKEPYVQERLRQMPKDNLVHFKAHLLLARWLSVPLKRQRLICGNLLFTRPSR